MERSGDTWDDTNGEDTSGEGLDVTDGDTGEEDKDVEGSQELGIAAGTGTDAGVDSETKEGKAAVEVRERISFTR